MSEFFKSPPHPHYLVQDASLCSRCSRARVRGHGFSYPPSAPHASDRRRCKDITGSMYVLQLYKSRYFLTTSIVTVEAESNSPAYDRDLFVHWITSEQMAKK